MPPSSSSILNGFAWVGIFLLLILAFTLVQRLGFPGILILGLLTTLICLRVELTEDVPTWGRASFEARMTIGRTVEERAAAGEVRSRVISPLRYSRACGFLLIAAGLVGTLLQFWE